MHALLLYDQKCGHNTDRPRRCHLDCISEKTDLERNKNHALVEGLWRSGKYSHSDNAFQGLFISRRAAIICTHYVVNNLHRRTGGLGFISAWLLLRGGIRSSALFFSWVCLSHHIFASKSQEMEGGFLTIPGMTSGRKH